MPELLSWTAGSMNASTCCTYYGRLVIACKYLHLSLRQLPCSLSQTQHGPDSEP